MMLKVVACMAADCRRAHDYIVVLGRRSPRANEMSLICESTARGVSDDSADGSFHLPSWSYWRRWRAPTPGPQSALGAVA